jgi:hypothetical protein
VFAVPVDGGGWALGVVSRAAPQGRILIGHFFGPRWDDPPDEGEVPDLAAGDALTVERFGDGGLHDGSWPVIGKLEGWRREDWPVPAFQRKDVVSGAVRKVVYDDADPSEEASVEPIEAGEADGLPKDGVQGAAGVSALLARRLS